MFIIYKINHKTYKVYFYHVNQEYKDTWIKKWQSNNEYVLNDIFESKGIKTEFIYLKEKRDKLSVH